MKRTLLSLAALSLCTLAIAGGKPPHQPQPQQPQGNVNVPIAVGVGVGGNATSQSRSQARAQAQANNRNTVSLAPTQTSTTTVNLTLPETKAQAPIVLETVKEAATKEPVAEKAELPVVVSQYDTRPVNTPYAPNINPTSPCALTVSGGLQLKDLGLSVGGTPIAEFCKNLEIGRAAWNMQDVSTAEEIMCGEASYRAARKRVKRPCAEDKEAEAKRAEAILNQVAEARTEPLLP